MSVGSNKLGLLVWYVPFVFQLQVPGISLSF